MIKLNVRTMVINRFKWVNVTLFCLLCIWILTCLLCSFSNSTEKEVVTKVIASNINKDQLAFFEFAVGIVKIISFFTGIVMVCLGIFKSKETLGIGLTLIALGLMTLIGSFVFMGLLETEGLASETSRTVEKDVFSGRLYFENLTALLGSGFGTALKIFLAINVAISVFVFIEVYRFRNLEYFAKRYIRDFYKHANNLNNLNIYTADKWVNPDDMGRNLAKYFE